MTKYKITQDGELIEEEQGAIQSLFSFVKPSEEVITDDTIAELSNNKGDDEDE